MKNRFDLIDTTRPWAIQEDRIRPLLEAALSATMDGTDQEVSSHAFNTRGGSAVISVRGPLMQYDSIFTMCGGARSYEGIYADMMAADSDPAIKNVIFLIDSPGGEIAGLAELCEYIIELGKPTYAHVRGMAASAAYWLAVSTGSISASSVSYEGSIGAIASLTDDRKHWETQGIEELVFVSSASPYKHVDPKTEAGAAQIQEMVDQAGQIFVDYVAKRRGVSSKFVLEKFGGGKILLAENALKVGMIDSVSNLRAVLKSIESGEKLGGKLMMGADINKTEGKDDIEDKPDDDDDLKRAEGSEPVNSAAEPPPSDDDDIEDEDEEKKEANKLDAFVKRYPGKAAKLMKMGARRERDRIKGIAEAAAQTLHNKDLAAKAMFASNMTAGDFLVAQLNKSKESASGVLKGLDKDAGEIKEIAALQKQSESVDLETAATAHAASMVKKNV